MATFNFDSLDSVLIAAEKAGIDVIRNTYFLNEYQMHNRLPLAGDLKIFKQAQLDQLNYVVVFEELSNEDKYFCDKCFGLRN